MRHNPEDEFHQGRLGRCCQVCKEQEEAMGEPISCIVCDGCEAVSPCADLARLAGWQLEHIEQKFSGIALRDYCHDCTRRMYGYAP